MKILRISSCRECPGFKIGTGVTIPNKCNAVKDPIFWYKILPAEKPIPDWCPLPDSDEKQEQKT